MNEADIKIESANKTGLFSFDDISCKRLIIKSRIMRRDGKVNNV